MVPAPSPRGPVWRLNVPAPYRAQVVWPVRFEHFAEPAARALKTLGYDIHGQCCFQHRQAALTRESLDEFGLTEEETCGEEIWSWRMQDGRWLRRAARGGASGCCNDRRFQPAYEVVATPQG